MWRLLNYRELEPGEIILDTDFTKWEEAFVPVLRSKGMKVSQAKNYWPSEKWYRKELSLGDY